MRTSARLVLAGSLAVGLVLSAAASAGVQTAYEALSVGLVADSDQSKMPRKTVFEQLILEDRMLGAGDFYVACELAPLDDEDGFQVRKRGRVVLLIDLLQDGGGTVRLGKWKMKQAANGVAVGFHRPAPRLLEAGDRLRWTFRHRNFDPMDAGFGYELLFGVVHSSLLEEE